MFVIHGGVETECNYASHEIVKAYEKYEDALAGLKKMYADYERDLKQDCKDNEIDYEESYVSDFREYDEYAYFEITNLGPDEGYRAYFETTRI